MKDILDSLEMAIEKSGFSKQEICKRLGVSTLTLWRILRGKRKLTVDFMSKFAIVIGEDPREFLGEMLQQDAENPTLPRESRPGERKRKTTPEPVKRARGKRSAA